MANSIVFNNNLREVLTGLETATENMLIDIGIACQGYAKENTPERTGTLKNSIGVEVKADEKAVYVGTMIDKFPEEPYGKYVELGARGRSGVHMLQRAVEEHKDEYKKIAERSLKNA